MSEPKHEFLRRGEVEAWLEDEGIRPNQVRKLFEEKVIAGAPLPGRMRSEVRGRRAEGGKKQGENGAKKHHVGRPEGYLPNYYRKSQVKEALKL